MIEWPEARVLQDQLNQVAKGQKIMSVVANHSPHKFAFFHGEPTEYPKLLTGKVINGAESYGGRAQLVIEDARLKLFDGVNVRYLSEGQKRPDKHQLLIELEDGALSFSVQMYGGILACPEDADLGFYDEVAREKVSPLSAGFDRLYFDSLFDGIKPSLSVKALLATEQRIPGLGNGVLQDILFHAKVHPKSRALSLSDAQREALFQSVKQTLAEMMFNGGRDVERDLFGVWGGYKTALSSKTYGDPCPVCGGAIIKQAYLGGNIYFCSNCQEVQS